jgi:hypothetical protein
LDTEELAQTWKNMKVANFDGMNLYAPEAAHMRFSNAPSARQHSDLQQRVRAKPQREQHQVAHAGMKSRLCWNDFAESKTLGEGFLETAEGETKTPKETTWRGQAQRWLAEALWVL